MIRATIASVWDRRLGSLSSVVLLVACGGASSGTQQPGEPPTSPPPPPPIEAVEVLTYNVWLLPPVARDRAERARLMPEHLVGPDVLVLTEAFDDEARGPLLAALEEQGYAATPVLGQGVQVDCGTSLGPIRLSVSFGLNGGVVVLGRHRLAQSEQRLFGEACAGEDCCAPKGVVYARFEKEDGKCLHVFGTHLQNQDTEVQGDTDPAAARREQLGIVRAFIDEQVDQSTCAGPVFVAGDLNLNRRELADEAAAILRTRTPGHFYGPRSWGRHNAYTDAGEGQHLDYVLATEDFAAPLYAVNETRMFREAHDFTEGSGILGLVRRGVLADLSDHHAVLGRFEWSRSAATSHFSWRLGSPPTDLSCVKVGERHLCGDGLTLGAETGDGCTGLFECDDVGHSRSLSPHSLCAADTVLRWCPRGRARCQGVPEAARCIQVAEPNADTAASFDDYLCYVRAGVATTETTDTGRCSTPAPRADILAPP